MSCPCIKINPLPNCLGEQITFSLTGFTFPNNLSASLKAKITNLATGRVSFITFTTNGSGVPALNIFSLYPLPLHPYLIEFLTTSNTPVTAIITDTGDEGCCVEFDVHKETVSATTFNLTAQGCITTS